MIDQLQYHLFSLGQGLGRKFLSPALNDATMQRFAKSLYSVHLAQISSYPRAHIHRNQVFTLAASPNNQYGDIEEARVKAHFSLINEDNAPMIPSEYVLS